MSNIKIIIDSLKQVSSIRGGKVIVFTILFSAAVLGIIHVFLLQGIITQLDGIYKYSYIVLVCIFFLSLAVGLGFIVLGIRLKPKTTKLVTNKSTTNIHTQMNETRVTTDNRKVWKYIILICLVVIAFVIYVVGWIYISQGIISPLVQQMTMEQFDWSLFIPNYLISCAIGFAVTIFWIILPIMFYFEANKVFQKINMPSGIDYKQVKKR